jgi:hypothetical protein
MITRFTAYRRQISQRGTHTEAQRNPDDQPQYEGVVFSDGSCVIKWLTSTKSVSVFSSLADMLQIHGHPEYGTDIEWHDGHMPEEWAQHLLQHAEHEQASLHATGLTQVKVVATRNAELSTPKGHFTKQIYPVPL